MEVLVFIGIAIGIVWAMLAICIPFMVYSMLGKLDELIALQSANNRTALTTSKNVYAFITGGE